MERLVTLSRAAKLVGVSRGNLQRRIQDGELTSFEGKLELAELARTFPHVQLEDNSMLERIERIIENAAIRARNRTPTMPPDMQTLAARVNILGEELVEAKLEISQFYNLFDKLKSKLNNIIHENELAAPAVRELSAWLLHELDLATQKKFEKFPLLVTDTFLRIMAAQVHIQPSGHDFFVEGNNSILESGLSAGLALNYGCSNGNCGKCKARLISGEVKKTRAHDYVLSEKDKLQGYFLTCSHTAVTDIVIEADEAGSERDIPQQHITAWVRKVNPANDRIHILNVKTPRTQRLRFLAGQQVRLEIPGIASTLAHIASCPCDEMNLQFHLADNPEDVFAQYILTSARHNDVINIEGPGGHFVLHEDEPNPVVFIAFGLGFAPTKSLIEHAMTLDVTEHIYLYWVMPKEEDLYLHNHCRAWADAFERFTYTPVLTHDRTGYGVTDVLQSLHDTHTDLSALQFYIAGPEDAVATTKNALHAQGVVDTNIFSEITPTY